MHSAYFDKDVFLEIVEKTSESKKAMYENILNYIYEMYDISILPNIAVDDLLDQTCNILIERAELDDVEVHWLKVILEQLEIKGVVLTDCSLKDVELFLEGIITFCNLEKEQKMDYKDILEIDDPNEAIANILSKILTLSPFKFLDFLDIQEEFINELKSTYEVEEEIQEPTTLLEFVKQYDKRNLNLLENVSINLPSPSNFIKEQIPSICNKDEYLVNNKDIRNTILEKYYGFTKLETSI